MSPNQQRKTHPDSVLTMNQTLTHFAQHVERQHQALRRLRENLQAGKPLSLEDAEVREVLEATTAVSDVLRSLGIASPERSAGLLEQLGSMGISGTKEHTQLLAICSVSQVVNSTLDLTAVLNLVMDTIIRVTGAERGFVMLLDNETGELAFRTARNMDQKTILGQSFEISLSVVNRVAGEARPLVTTNAQSDPRFSMQESVLNYSLRSILCVPLLVKDQVIGVIYADSRIKSGLFSERDLDVLVTFANQVATAIDNARLFESVSVAKNLMDNIFASIPSGVITTDTAGKITSVNRAAENILGVSARNIIGMPHNRALAQLWSTPLARLMGEVIANEKKFIGFEIQPQLYKRGTVNLSVSLSPLKNANDDYQGVAMVLDDLTETKRLEAVRDMFRRYVSPAVVDRLPADAAELRLGGNRQEISVVFADIRGFTSLSEGLAPEELVVILNQYLSMAAECILTFEGTLDKFVGDAVMAIFNAPLPQPDHVLNAVSAAIAIQKTIREFHQTCGPDTPHLQYGIAISVGEAVVGNVGTASQMNYTAIGDVVNLAGRLQEVAAGGQILLSESAYNRISGHVEAKMLERVQVKGRKSSEQVFELLSLRD
jgi:adenylate cyclase